MDVIAQTNDGGVSNLAVVKWAGDGTAVDVTCGFKPRYVKVLNLTSQVEIEKFYEMLATQTLNTAVSGAKTITTASSILLRGGDSGDFRGFTLSAALNVNGNEFHALAFG